MDAEARRNVRRCFSADSRDLRLGLASKTEYAQQKSDQRNG